MNRRNTPASCFHPQASKSPAGFAALCSNVITLRNHAAYDAPGTMYRHLVVPAVRVTRGQASVAAYGAAMGRLTQRRSWCEISTALMTSWTHSPSSKLPSLPSISPSTSLAKFAVRLA